MTFLCFGMAFLGLNRIVLVPVSILVPIPFRSLPNSLAKDVVQSSLLFPLIKWRNSNEVHVFGTITGIATCEFIVEYISTKY